MAPATSDECLSFLDEAKTALENIRDLTAKESDCRQKEQQSQRAYDAEKKKMNDEVSRTLRSRREEISKTYDEEIAKDQDQLRKAKNKREKARNEGVKDRIAEETEDFEKDITSLRTQIKNLGVSAQLPAYCRSRLYMSLFYPKHPGDILALFIGILIFFALIPGIIYLMLPEKRPLYMTITYVVLLIVVVGLYIYIGSRSRKEHAAAIKECRGLYDQIYDKERSIRTTARSIRQDPSEGAYDLARYDDDISKIQQDLDSVTSRKKDALDNYENVTKNILTDEIEGNYKDKLDELAREHDEAEAELKDISARLKSERLNLSDNFSPLLGKEFSDPVKIDSLTVIIQDQGCQNLSETIAYYKANEKQIRADERARSKKGVKETAPEEHTEEASAAEEPAAKEPEQETPAAEESAAKEPEQETPAAEESVQEQAAKEAQDTENETSNDT